MPENKSYFAVIPSTVRYDRRLSPYARLLYGELTALSNHKGFCWASNTYFSELYGVTKQAISKWIKSLEDCGYITVKYKKKGKEIVSRSIAIKVSTGVDGVSTTDEGGINIGLKGYQPRIKENNTFNNKEEYMYRDPLQKLKENQIQFELLLKSFASLSDIENLLLNASSKIESENSNWEEWNFKILYNRFSKYLRTCQSNLKNGITSKKTGNNTAVNKPSDFELTEEDDFVN